MNIPKRRSTAAHKYALLLGSASITTMVAVGSARAQDAAPAAPAAPQQVAQAAPTQTAQADQATMPVSEQVLVTGSLIHGAAAIGVPVTSLGDADFKQSGAVTIANLFVDVPSVYEIPQNDVIAGGGYVSRDINVNLRNLSMRNSRQLLLVDGIQFPNQGAGGCQTDPSIIPQLAAERVDLLTDGASATYGSSAVTGVINVILKRGYDGAITQVQFGGSTDIGHPEEQVTQLFGRTWDGGDITVSYEWYMQQHTVGGVRPYFTANFNTYAGVDNRMALINSDPGIISYGGNLTAAAPQAPPGTPAGFTATTGTTCDNCYAIPAGQNGAGGTTNVTWAGILSANTNPTAFAANERNLWLDAWTEPNQQRTGETLTFDQKIVNGISFFADAWNSNRQALMVGENSGNSISIAVPTTNPYYPTGTPSGTVIKVNYDFNPEFLSLGSTIGGEENPDRVTSQEVDERYDLGLNIDLPFDWIGKLYGAQTSVREISSTTGTVNANMVSAALGWTVPGVAANNAQPYTIGSFIKPANIPYLNLFCDPLEYTCNSPATLNYITGYSYPNEFEMIDQIGLNADGPVYDLPTGEVKAAVGAVYQRWSFNSITNTSNTTNVAITNYSVQTGSRNIESVFGQLNIPLIGKDFTLPLVEGFNIEAAIRYDNYSDFGSTTNPKISADWDVGWGLTLKGSFGTSFRAPEFQEESTSGAGLINLTATGTLSGTIQTCAVTGNTTIGNTTARELAPTVGNCPQYIGGISSGYNPTVSSVTPSSLLPETAQNLDLGFEYAPTYSFLNGLDIQATYWYLRIRNVINNYYGVAGLQSSELDNPIWEHTFLTPANDPNFNADVLALVNGPKSTISPSILSSTVTLSNGMNVSAIQFISISGNRNVGWQAVNGIDFQASYDWDMGDWGAWNTGVTGTYNIDNKSQGGPGQIVNSLFTTPQLSGSTATDTGGRMKYRVRLGWADDDGWSVTGFMNFLPHFNSDTAVLPPSCFVGTTSCWTASGNQAYFEQYKTTFASLSNYVPGIYTFDLSIGYKTGDKPDSDYLKNLGIQLTITNILDKQAPYAYQINPPGGAQVHAYYSTTQGTSLGIDGRVITVNLTKTW